MRTSEVEQIKLLANALNNIGVAAIVTGGIAPATATVLGTYPAEDPWRLSAVVVVYITIGIAFFVGARRVLRELG